LLSTPLQFLAKLSLDLFGYIFNPDPNEARLGAIAARSTPWIFIPLPESNSDSSYGPSESSPSPSENRSTSEELNADEILDLIEELQELELLTPSLPPSTSSLSYPTSHLTSPFLSLPPTLSPTVSSTFSLTPSTTSSINQTQQMAQPNNPVPPQIPIMGALISPHSKEAPFFDGKPRHLLDFFDEFNLITAAANVTGQTKISAVVNYVCREAAELWRTYATFAGGNWDAFKDEVILSYPGVKAGSYTIGDLADLSRKQFTSKTIKTLDDLGKYHRKFMRIAGYLRTHQQLADAISNQYYWGGFRRSLRTKIEDHLERINPNRDLNVIASTTKIYQAAVRVLTKKSRSKNEEHRKKWSRRDDTSDSSNSSTDTNSSDSSTDSSDSSSDSTSRRNRTKKSRSKKEKKEAKKRDKKARRVDLSPTAISPPPILTNSPPPVKTEASETKDLLKELMRQMNQQSTEQARLFTNAINTLTQAPVAIAGNHLAKSSYGCNFCGQLAHMMRDCLTMMKYLVEGKAAKDSTGKLCTPTGAPIPPGDARGQTLQVRLDAWLAANPKPSSTTPTVSFNEASIVEIPTATVHFFESEILGPSEHVAETLQYEMGRETEDEAIALVETLANEAKKVVRAKKNGPATRNLPVPPVTVPSSPLPPTNIPPLSHPLPLNTPNTAVPATQPHTIPATRPNRAKFVSQAENPALQEEIIKMVLENKIEGGITLKHLFAISPTLRSKLVDYLRTHRVEAPHNASAASQAAYHLGEGSIEDDLIVSEAAVPLREVLCTVANVSGELAVLDEGSSVVVIREDLWLETGLPIQRALSMKMEGAHGDVASTLGGLPQLPITLDQVTFYVRAQVVPRAPFRILLGRPFFEMALSTIENKPGGHTLLTVTNPNPPFETLTIPTTPRKPRCSHPHHSSGSHFQSG
jgi:hypothetical protein